MTDEHITPRRSKAMFQADVISACVEYAKANGGNMPSREVLRRQLGYSSKTGFSIRFREQCLDDPDCPISVHPKTDNNTIQEFSLDDWVLVRRKALEIADKLHDYAEVDIDLPAVVVRYARDLADALEL